MQIRLHNLAKNSGGNNIITTNNNNGVDSTERVVITNTKEIIYIDGRLDYGTGMYCLILFLNFVFSRSWNYSGWNSIWQNI